MLRSLHLEALQPNEQLDSFSAAFSMLPHPPSLLPPPVACLPLRKCFGKNMKLSYGIMLGLCLNSAWTLLLAGLVLNTSGTVVSGGSGGV